jgi:thermitase
MRKIFLLLIFLFLFSGGTVAAAETTGETIIVRKDGTYELVKGDFFGILSEGDYTQPNFVYELYDEPYQDKQWYLDSTREIDIKYKAALKELEGVKLSDIIVAVLDTGVDYKHEDLKDMMWDGKDCVSDTGAKLGGCIYGYSFAYGGSSKDPMPGSSDGSYHGTHVAGTIGAAINGKGVAGVAKNAKIMGIRADSGRSLNTYDLIRGIAFANKNGAKIINASWGTPCQYGGTPRKEDSALKKAIEDFPGLFISAAGNGKCNHDDSMMYTTPSEFRKTLKNMIVVAASDSYDNLAVFSDYGGKTVDVAAPGVAIYNTVPGGYRNLDGTSMATPVVVGIAAAIWGINPSASRDVISKVIREAVETPSALKGKVMYGRLNYLTAVKKTKALVSPTSTPSPTLTPTLTLTPTPTVPVCPVCKSKGDYNCDGNVNGLDYSWWKQEFVDKILHDGKWEASSDCTVVSLDDYSVWRDNYLK